MTWREYHEATKHSPESLRRSQHVLDWENMPDPFRHYEGVPVLDLPADPPAPEIPALALLAGAYGEKADTDGAAFLSRFLFYSAAVSASKRVPATGARYALRVNPSSGNLHPTEFHFVTRGLQGWPDGLFHYRPSSHMAEQRGLGDFKPAGGSAPVTFILTSIVWREAWKYGDRAYRYCLHDIGHAAEALRLAARAIGWDSRVNGQFNDDEIAEMCDLNGDEWPMLLVELSPTHGELVRLGGVANRLSAEPLTFPPIESIHAATRCKKESRLVPGLESSRSFGEVARKRRSALDFTGERSLPRAGLSAILAAAATPANTFVQLYLYVHRVEGLPPGVYRYWQKNGELERMRLGDQRVMAAGLSLGQDLAGNACVAFSMAADLDRATCLDGDRGYRYAHFEAGAIGQRLYVAAEALGLQGTGIGAFFDDEVNRYLDLSAETGQVIYHFAIGHAVPDTRLQA